MFKLSIVTPVKVYADQQATAITVPGQVGYLGVLSHHAPLITALSPGLLTVRDNSDVVKEYSISGGFMEVSNNVCTILADAIEPLTDIDTERAQGAYKRSRDRIAVASNDNEKTDTERARKAMARASNRIDLAKRSKS